MSRTLSIEDDVPQEEYLMAMVADDGEWHHQIVDRDFQCDGTQNRKLPDT